MHAMQGSLINTMQKVPEGTRKSRTSTSTAAIKETTAVADTGKLILKIVNKALITIDRIGRSLMLQSITGTIQGTAKSEPLNIKGNNLIVGSGKELIGSSTLLKIETTSFENKRIVTKIKSPGTMKARKGGAKFLIRNIRIQQGITMVNRTNGMQAVVMIIHLLDVAKGLCNKRKDRTKHLLTSAAMNVAVVMVVTKPTMGVDDTTIDITLGHGWKKSILGSEPPLLLGVTCTGEFRADRRISGRSDIISRADRRISDRSDIISRAETRAYQ